MLYDIIHNTPDIIVCNISVCYTTSYVIFMIYYNLNLVTFCSYHISLCYYNLDNICLYSKASLRH